MRALVQHGDAVAHAEGAAHVVGDDQPGDAEVAGADHELVHDGRGDRVEPGGGLVVENVARLEGDRARDSHPLPHPAAQLRRVLVLDARQLDHRRGSPRSARGSRARRSPASPGRAGCSRPPSSSRTAPRTGRRSRSVPAAPRARVAVQLVHHRAVHQHPRRRRARCRPDDELERDALPRARAADDDGVLAVGDLERRRRAGTCFGAERSCVTPARARSQEHQRPEGVQHQDRLAAEHHGPGGRESHALGAGLRVEAAGGSPSAPRLPPKLALFTRPNQMSLNR